MRIFRLLAVVLFCCTYGYAHAKAGGEVLTLGITPQQATTEMARLWGPVCQYLSNHTEYEVLFKTSKDLVTFWSDMTDGVYDLVYVSSARYVYAHTKPGYTAFAQENESPLVVMLVARKDGPASVEELQGKTLAVHSLSSLAAQLSHAYLNTKGIDVSLTAVSSHESVFRTVEKGIYPVGAINLRIFGMLDPLRQEEFKVLWKSEPLPPFAFAAHPRVSHKSIKAIQRALVEMNNNPEGKALLAALNLKGIVSAKDGDYNVIRKMNIKME